MSQKEEVMKLYLIGGGSLYAESNEQKIDFPFNNHSFSQVTLH